MIEKRLAYVLWGNAAHYCRSANAYQKIRMAAEDLNADILVPRGFSRWVPEELRARCRLTEICYPRCLVLGRVARLFAGSFVLSAVIRCRKNYRGFLVNTGSEFSFVWIRLAECMAKMVLLCWDPPGIAVRDGRSCVARFRCCLMDALFACAARHSASVILNLHSGFLKRFSDCVRRKFHVFENGTNVVFNQRVAMKVHSVPKRIAVNSAFWANKGCWEVAKLFVSIWREDSEVSIVWVGIGGDREMIDAYFHKAGVPQASYFLGGGTQEFTMEKLATASVALNAYRDVESLRWNYVLKAPEFLSLGLPIVSARLPGVAHYIDEERTGLFFEPGDWEAAKDKVLTVLHDPKKLAAMRLAALSEAGRHDWKLVNMRIAADIRESFP